MWSKLIVSVAATLMLIKMFFPTRWQELKAQVDRGVNIMLVLLALGYALGLVLRYLGKA